MEGLLNKCVKIYELDKLRLINNDVVKIVFFSKRKIDTFLDIVHLTNLHTLDIERGNIVKFGKGTKSLRNLTIINQNHCINLFTNINIIPLENLTVKKTKINILPNFHSNLVKLAITHSKLDNIQSLSNLINLQVINFDNNNLFDLPDLSCFSSLKTLCVSNNKLKCLNKLPIKLNKLLANNNFITNVDLSSLNNLDEINLQNNKLDTITLPQSKIINISYNKLQELKFYNKITNKYVEKLDIKHNFLTELPNIDYSKLELFDVSFNHLYSLPKIEKHKILPNIYINNNWLTDNTIPKETMDCLYMNYITPNNYNNIYTINYHGNFLTNFKFSASYTYQKNNTIYHSVAKFTKTYRYHWASNKIKKCWKKHYYRVLLFSSKYPYSICQKILNLL